MKHSPIYFLPLLLLLLSGCDPEVKFGKRIGGSWNIAVQETQVINSDGSISDERRETDVGELTITEPDGSPTYLEYSLTLTNSNYRWNFLPFKTDDTNQRVFFYFFFCSDILGCDWVGTIEENLPDRQVWVFYRSTTGSNGAPAHRKTTWRLERL
ncbi:MAG: hypothetical protein NWR72_10370 [Bacteroidia bacterium]|nr:hypothetical protein [Bacteroidia bacterium]